MEKDTVIGFKKPGPFVEDPVSSDAISFFLSSLTFDILPKT